MIIAKAPFRMSFFGGGTDFQPFFQEHGGSVIATSFDKYCYTTVRHLPKFFEYSTQIIYSKIEKVKTIDEIQHPMVREAMKFLDMQNLFLTYDGDLPARSGLGSSSAFTNALLLAFHGLKGQYVSKEQLAQEAIYVERILCAESGGWQDQVATAVGGLNRIDFRDNQFQVSPIVITPERKLFLNENLMLFFTGFTRLSSEISKEQESVAKDKTADLLQILDYVDEAQKILVSKSRDLDDFGQLLHETWLVKKSLTQKISNDHLDDIYGIALKHGALGGKLLGAGGGGYFLFYVPKEKQESLKRALSNLIYVPFSFENEGANILYFRPEQLEETQ